VINPDILRETVGKLNKGKTNNLLDEFIASEPNSEDTWKVVEAFQQGMEIVGNLFEIGKYCAGDLIFAGELLDSSINKLKPLLGVSGKTVPGVLYCLVPWRGMSTI
jgi:methanogenic corrinoid protein MtbC1